MNFKLFVFASLLIVLGFACRRKEPTPIDVAGKGGNATIVDTPKHHSRYIDSCTIYIKYNTLDMPSQVFNPSDYDDSVKCVKINDSISIGTFKGLKKGNYYMYGVGWDKKGPYSVQGGKPFTITGDNTYYLALFVSEVGSH